MIGRKSLLLVLFCVLATPCLAEESVTLLEKRKGHTTKLTKKERSDQPMPVPPEEEFKIVRYQGKAGKLAAYLSVDHPSGKPLPAIIWLTGGLPPAEPGSFLWESTEISNEQSARVYRFSNIISMFPVVRGGAKEVDGIHEGFYGEVDDVISALEFLKKDPAVDPKRIYLGGHSGGGTLVLLVAAATDDFAGIISLGPTEDDYGKAKARYEWTKKERALRAPIEHLAAIKSPTYVLEGEAGNSAALKALKKVNKNSQVKIVTVESANHFNVIHPVNVLFAKAINQTKAGSGTLDISLSALKRSFLAYEQQNREADDLEVLAEFRRRGGDFFQKQTALYYLTADEKGHLQALKKHVQKDGFTFGKVEERKDRRGDRYYLLTLSRKLDLLDLKAVFRSSTLAQSYENADEGLFMNHWKVQRDR